MPPAILVEDVSKTFRIVRQPSRSLKESLIRLLRRELVYESFIALDGVSLRVERGETVSIIGPNGSGKSTLFKLLSRVMRPTRGRIEVQGRISPLIELSAGFHPELSGLENVFLNAGIYGLRRTEVSRKLDGIREFAGIGDFVFSPVRTYSSGMMARLAFALAINVDAEVLLVDEVLSVGDAAFQSRCLQAIEVLKAAGVTVLLVSHDLTTVARISDRVILLERGVVRAEGDPAHVITAYVGPERAKTILERAALSGATVPR